MAAATFELAQIVQQYGNDFIDKHQPLQHHRQVLTAISACRTVALGGHVDACDNCGHIRISYKLMVPLPVTVITSLLLP
jgi:hypothetical protein